MYQIQQDKLAYFEEQISNPNRKISYNFTLNGKPLSANQIMDNPTLTTDLGLEQFGVGNVCITSLECTFKSEVSLNYGDCIAIEIGLYIQNKKTGKWEWLFTPLGSYYIDVIEEKSLTKKIKAYDGMCKLNKSYNPTTQHTSTYDLALEVANQCGLNLVGITQESNNYAIDGNRLGGYSLLEMISLIAGAIGGHVRINRLGDSLEFIEPTNGGLVFDEGDFLSPTTDNQSSYNITSLIIKHSEEIQNDEGEVIDTGIYVIGEGEEANTLTLENPLLRNHPEQGEVILNKIQQLNGYKRFDTEILLADFRLDPLDIVTYEYKGETYITPILYLKTTLSYQGIKHELQSPTVAVKQDGFEFKGSISKRLENTYTKAQTDACITVAEKSIMLEVSEQYVDKNGAGELISSTIEQNPESVMIGFNGISDSIVMSKDGMKVKSAENSYTELSHSGLSSYDNDGNKTLGIRNGGMTFYAHDNNEFTGYISQSASQSGINGVSLGMSALGEYLSLGASTSETPNSFSQTGWLVLSRNETESFIEGINSFKNWNFSGKTLNNVGTIKLKGDCAVMFDSYSDTPSAIWEANNSGRLAVFGGKGTVFGYRTNGTDNNNIMVISDTDDTYTCKINTYENWNFNNWYLKRCKLRYDGFTRSKNDYGLLFQYSSSSESQINLELADDYTTSFNIQANNYADGGRYIARFKYVNGSSSSSQGIDFYRALNMNGYNISNVANMNTLAVSTEEIVASDIKIASPYSVMSRSGEVETLSVSKTTDDVIEHNDTVVVNAKAKVYLPTGLSHMGYLVQVTSNKLCQIAVTEKLDDHFIIETNTDEDVTVDYCIKAFQPKYQTRVATYGELQGESPIAITSDKADKPVSEVEYDVAVLNDLGGEEAPYFISSKNELKN